MTTDTDTAGAPQSAGWRGKFAGFALGLSIFAVLWFVAAGLGSKFGIWNWEFGLQTMIGSPESGLGRFVFGGAFVVAVVALVTSLVQAPRKRAFMLAAGALLISLYLGGRMLGQAMLVLSKPPLHDIQTDWSDPIQPSDALAKVRQASGAQNPIETAPIVPGAELVKQRWPDAAGRLVSEVQEEAEFDTATHESPKETPYPMLAPLVTAAAPDAAYTAALAAVESRGWTVVLADPEAGTIEATEESFWFGFKDDVMIRVRSDEMGARIDVRSTSRVGLSDLGANAKRVRNLLDEIETRLGKGA